MTSLQDLRHRESNKGIRRNGVLLQGRRRRIYSNPHSHATFRRQSIFWGQRTRMVNRVRRIRVYLYQASHIPPRNAQSAFSHRNADIEKQEKNIHRISVTLNRNVIFKFCTSNQQFFKLINFENYKDTSVMIQGPLIMPSFTSVTPQYEVYNFPKRMQSKK